MIRSALSFARRKRDKAAKVSFDFKSLSTQRIEEDSSLCFLAANKNRISQLRFTTPKVEEGTKINHKNAVFIFRSVLLPFPHISSTLLRGSYPCLANCPAPKLSIIRNPPGKRTRNSSVFCSQIPAGEGEQGKEKPKASIRRRDVLRPETPILVRELLERPRAERLS